MKQVNRDKLLALFERMEREHWAYEWGAAREGCVDCSGAFVWAYKQLGGPAIAHGSNSILRQSMDALRPMAQARPGWAAVKVRDWRASEAGNRWYGQQPGDCYHIGLVGRDGGILNAQGVATGFVASEPGSWYGCAPLDDVDYSEEDENVERLYRARVDTQRDPLRVRAWALTGEIVGHVPKGREVDVLADAGDGWPRIRYGELTGYASGAYLTRIDEAGDAPEPDAGDADEAMTTLMREDGVTITLTGRWRVAAD